jgi:hypothetical protein
MIYRLRSELFIAAIRRVSSGRFGRRGRRSPQSFVHDQRMSSVDVAMFDGVHELRDQEPTASAFRQRIFGQIAPSRGRGERPWFRNYHLQIAVPPYPCQPNACTGTGAPAVANSSASPSVAPCIRSRSRRLPTAGPTCSSPAGIVTLVHSDGRTAAGVDGSCIGLSVQSSIHWNKPALTHR